ncbi:MAG: 2-dehydro-3-deoxygalactonokinase [Verrucomicrobiota bacterium]
MISEFTSCDWGTTNLRVRIVRDDAVVIETRSGQGASSLNSPQEFREALAAAMDAMGAPKPVVISGMAGSSIGWKELPYARLPFRLDGSDAVVDEIEPDIFLISGVRSEDDVMRGEETELLGLDIGQEEAVVILPGTHSKHCVLRNGAMVAFRTFMSGELHALLGSHGILRQSVAPGWDEAAFLEGIDESRHGALTSSLFKVRTRALLHGKSPESNGSFLSGLLIGSELSVLPKDLPLILAAAGAISTPYRIAFHALGLDARSHIISEDEAAILAVRGQRKILEQRA